MCVKFWLRFEPNIQPTRFEISFLFIIDKVYRKIHFCLKLFGFFPRWILIHLMWNLPHFVPNSVEILTWNFRKKTISGGFFRNFVQTKAILYQNLWNFALLSEILFRVRIAPKKFTQVPSYVVSTQVRRHVHKQITERRYGVEKPGRFVLGKPVLFTLGLGLTTPYSFGYFGLKFLPDVRHCVIHVLAEICAADSSHKIGNKFFIDNCQGRKEGSFVCETV